MTLPDSIIPQKFTALRKSKFRSKFKLSQKDRDYITAKGLETIKDHAYPFLNPGLRRLIQEMTANKHR
jgi:hypothetical protein